MVETAERRPLTGWGRRTRSVSWVVDLPADQVGEQVRAASARGVLARGLGRSYGDAAQNAGGLVLRVAPGAIEIEPDPVPPSDHAIGSGGRATTATVTTSAGTSLAALADELLARGYYLAVSPGTLQVSVGGAIASDVHGKNHHRRGSFADHVAGIELVAADGEPRWLTPDQPLFWGTCGGMGLTGVITRAALRVISVESSWILARTTRAQSLEETYQLLRTADLTAAYSVAWVDLTAQGSRLGRSVVHTGDHARAADLTGKAAQDRWRPIAPARVTLPDAFPSGLISPMVTRMFNEAWFRKAPAQPHDHLEHVQGFFYPLDAVREWNRAYGRRGFLQYQFVVPDDATDVVTDIVGQIVARRCGSFLNVLKRLGPGNQGPLSFPRAGWTLAVDLPVSSSGSGLGALLRAWDDQIVEAGGRVYLTKDGRLSPASFRRMYPRWEEFASLRDEVGARGRFVSDLSRRIGLEE